MNYNRLITESTGFHVYDNAVLGIDETHGHSPLWLK